LRDLRFLAQDTERKSHEDRFPADDFWEDVIPWRVLKPAVNLTSLAIESSIEFGSLDLSSITYPCLTSLSLSNFVWDDVRFNPQVIVPEAENFIVRHGKTLKKLELHSCTICIPHDNDDSPHTLVRSWADVWNRFADELTELEDLVVEYNFGRRYTFFVYGFDDSDSAYFLRGTEQDSPALEAFVTIVKERKRATSG